MAAVRSIFSSKGASAGDAGDRGNSQGVEVVLTGLAGLKVRSTALHTALPWVLCGDDLGFVSIHDYEHSVLIFKMQPDLHVASAHASSGSAALRCTRVRLVIFLDAVDAPDEHVAVARPVAAVTDIALFFIDCATRRVRHVSAVDARLINALHIVPCSPAGERRAMLAVACADGYVRMIETSNGQVLRELSCGKKKAPAFNHLAVFNLPGGHVGKGESSAEGKASLVVVAASSDGSLFLWNMWLSDTPVCTCPAGAEVMGLQLSGASEAGNVLLTSIHADKTMALWAIDAKLSLAEVVRSKPRSLVRLRG